MRGIAAKYGLAALARLGVTLKAQHYFPFQGIRFIGDGSSVDASFPSGTGAGIRRTYLHQALIDRQLRKCMIEQLGIFEIAACIAEVRMHVPQSRDHKLAGAVDHFVGGRYPDRGRHSAANREHGWKFHDSSK